MAAMPTITVFGNVEDRQQKANSDVRALLMLQLFSIL